MSRSKSDNPPHKKPVEAVSTGRPPSPNTLCERIREAAYFKWQAAGCPCGVGVEFWLEAEAELNSRSDNGADVSAQS